MTEPRSDHFYQLSHSLDELCAAEDMEMQMLYRLASVRAAVRYNAVSTRKLFALGDLGDGFKDLCDDRAVLRSYFVNGRNMLLRHNKYMYGCLRIYVAESIDVFVLIDLRRRDIPLNDLAKNAVHYSARTVTLPLVSSVIRSIIPIITPRQKKQRIPTTRVVVFFVSR